MMLTAPLAALAVALAPADMEAQASRRLALEFERVGLNAPESDAVLTRAARTLAARAAASSAAEAAELVAITSAVSDSGGADPAPRAVILRGSPREQPLDAFLARSDLPDQPASVSGIGAAVRGQAAALVVLLTNRKATLDAFPRDLPKAGGAQTLCATLAPGLAAAELFVTRPGGRVQKLPAPKNGEGKACGRLGFVEPGRHTVEVIARGERGPEVAALFYVQVGPAAAGAAARASDEPADADAARAAILRRVNALRDASGAPEVVQDAVLDQVAQGYADLMAHDNFFAHVAPDGADLTTRLSRAGYRHLGAGENLGLAAGPLSAHFGIEHSPGHRATLIEPGYSRIGLGVTFQVVEGRPQALVAEVLAAPAPPPGAATPDPVDQAYRAIARERTTRALPPLARSRPLEAVALEHLDRAISIDEPKTRLPGFATADRVFARLDDVATTAVDLFVGDDPAQVVGSKNLGQAIYDRVGVASRRSDSARYGPGHLWMVVIYASPR